MTGKGFRLTDRLAFAALLFVHDKIDHVKALATRTAIGGKTVNGIGLRVYPHARGLVVVERATQHTVAVGLKSITRQDHGQLKTAFDLSYFHTKRPPDKNLFI